MAPIPVQSQEQVLFSMTWSHILASYISWYLFLVPAGLLRLNYPRHENQTLSVQECIIYTILFLLLPSHWI